MPDPDLHVTELGETGSTVAFCHGLFGQGRNWTQIGKQLAEDHRVLLVDMPNHGRSEWVDTIDYLDLADRVAGLFSADDPVTLVGHSMGGKIAMVLALKRPELVERLCVVDVSPGDLRQHAGVRRATSVRCADSTWGRSNVAATPTTRLRDDVPNDTVRSFLLQNLRRDGDAWRWQVNLEVLGRPARRAGRLARGAALGRVPLRRSGALGAAATAPTTCARSTPRRWTAGSHGTGG